MELGNYGRFGQTAQLVAWLAEFLVLARFWPVLGLQLLSPSPFVSLDLVCCGFGWQTMDHVQSAAIRHPPDSQPLADMILPPAAAGQPVQWQTNFASNFGTIMDRG